MCVSYWYAVSRACGCALMPLHRPSCPQIWGFKFTWGVEMIPQRHGWSWNSPQTSSYIHNIRHIQSVWAIGMLFQGHMGAPLYCYTGQVGPRFWNSRSLVECENGTIKSQLRLISTSNCFPHPYYTYIKCLSCWYSVSRAYWFTLSFGRGASKSTTQGGIFDLNMYITFDCARIAAFWKHRWKSHV